ncbi:MAG TPA: LD-carboxypeptidase, partial [Legionellaceae bacterium]|nr:LD-carboxypeptidase [Legionellaceae bacterium]
MKIKPRKLTEGSTIAIISPSYPAVYLYKKRLQRAISFLERQFKVNVVFAPNAHLREGHISCSAENRAYDIHWAFLNEKIDCIMSAIGGLNSNSILPHLDFDLISRNPKVFIGYSDVTALILPIYSLSNLITFHGPALLPEWGEYPVPFDYTVKYFYQSLFNKKPLGTLKASEFWTDEFLNWDLDADNRP